MEIKTIKDLEQWLGRKVFITLMEPDRYESDDKTEMKIVGTITQISRNWEYVEDPLVKNSKILNKSDTVSISIDNGFEFDFCETIGNYRNKNLDIVPFGELTTSIFGD